MREKGLLNPADIIVDSLFTKEVMVYPNSGKLKPLPINPYDGTKDPLDHV